MVIIVSNKTSTVSTAIELAKFNNPASKLLFFNPSTKEGRLALGVYNQIVGEVNSTKEWIGTHSGNDYAQKAGEFTSTVVSLIIGTKGGVGALKTSVEANQFSQHSSKLIKLSDSPRRIADEIVEGAGKVSIDALKDADKWLKALSTDELTALRRYQTGTYETINKSLREGTHLSEEMLSQVKNIDSAIGKGILGQDEIFYRGFTQKDLINKWDYLVNGGTFKFTDDAFVSTSKVQSKAVEFGKNSGSDGIVATVRVKKGENIANIDALKTPFFEDEAEILLGRGNKFSVVKAWVENGIKRVILEVN